jgi:hypothetical protein
MQLARMCAAKAVPEMLAILAPHRDRDTVGNKEVGNSFIVFTFDRNRTFFISILCAIVLHFV